MVHTDSTYEINGWEYLFCDSVDDLSQYEATDCYLGQIEIDGVIYDKYNTCYANALGKLVPVAS